MSYSPSPRPVYKGPSHIPYASVNRHLWGDEVSGRVADWIYVSSDKIHQIVFGLPPGGAFRHSDSYRTIFAADEMLYILSGAAAFNNPETGEVHPIQAGEAVFFRRDTWHHCFNTSTEPLRVLEFFAPPPSQGTSGVYAQTREYLTNSRYVPAEWMGRWPMAQEEARRAFTMQVLQDDDVLWRLEGGSQQLLVGIWVSTENLTVGKINLLPGTVSDTHSHGGDESLYLESGTLHIYLPDRKGQQWFELQPGDGFYLPAQVPHQYHNLTNDRAQFLFGVAPRYDPN